ncbi:hypothetical protein V2O64_14840 [Verrucomicrobiaceae bacterium 227]
MKMLSCQLGALALTLCMVSILQASEVTPGTIAVSTILLAILMPILGAWAMRTRISKLRRHHDPTAPILLDARGHRIQH